MKANKNFLAFISYKREDEKWAKWLQHKLEHYRIPTAIRKTYPDLPEFIRPIFKDSTDLSGGVLERAINEALAQSQYLIVICSPRAAKSQWVCKEVEQFIKLGKEENIIPFIIDGTPFSNDATECFPATLKALSGEKELLGININENGQDSAAVKVVARLFNLSFDTLWQRYRREQKKKTHRIFAGAILFVLFLLAVIAYILNSNIRLENSYKIIESQNTRLQNDSLIMAKHLERIQNDSIVLSQQKDSIVQQQQLLAEANSNLVQTNNELELKTNVALRNQAIAVAAKAIEHTDKGDSYLGRMLALEVLPKCLSLGDRPHTFEAEYALRHSNFSNHSQFTGHTQGINSIDISPDDKYIVSGADDHRVIIWNKNNGGKYKELKGHNDKVVSVKYSDDNKHLLTASMDGNILLWDLKNYTILRAFKNKNGHSRDISEVRFGPNATIISCDWDGYVVVWDMKTEKILHKFKAHDKGNLGIDISPDKRYLVTKSNAQNYPMKIWSTDNYDLVKQFSFIERCSVYKALFSPNNKILLATLGNGRMKLYDTSNWKEVEDREADFLGCSNACFSSDNKKMALGSNHGQDITVLNAATLDTIGKYYCEDKVSSCVFSHDNRFLLASDKNKKVYCWDLASQFPYDEIYSLEDVKKISVSDSKCLALTNQQKVVEYKSLASGKIQTRVFDVPEYVCDVFNLETGAYYCTIQKQLFDSKNQLITKPLPGQSVFAKKKTVIGLYDLYTNKVVFEDNFEKEIDKISVSKDGSYMAFSDMKGEISIYNLKTNKLVEVNSKNHSHGITEISFSKDNSTLLTTDYEKQTCLYNLSTKSKSYFKEHTNTSYAIYGDKNIFATYSDDGSIIIWDAATQKKINSNIFGLGWHAIKDLNFCNNDNNIVAAYNNRVGVWDTKSGIKIEDFEFPGVTSAFINGVNNELYLHAGATLKVYRYPSLQELINKTNLKFNDRNLSKEERRSNYLGEL